MLGCSSYRDIALLVCLHPDEIRALLSTISMLPSFTITLFSILNKAQIDEQPKKQSCLTGQSISTSVLKVQMMWLAIVLCMCMYVCVSMHMCISVCIYVCAHVYTSVYLLVHVVHVYRFCVVSAFPAVQIHAHISPRRFHSDEHLTKK